MNKQTLKKIVKSKTFIIIASVVVFILAVYLLFFNHKTTYQFVAVTRGSVTESVSLTGNTTPAQSVSLSFGSSGIISQTNTDLGKQVATGQVLAALNMNDLVAQLDQAKANVDIQQARLESLQTGARPEDIALYKQKYADASSALIIAMNNAYLQTDSAILRYADTLFTNGSTVTPVIKVSTQSWDEERSVETDRIIVGEKLQKWETTVGNLDSSSDETTISGARMIVRDAITFTTNFLSHLGTITANLNTNVSGLSASDIATYQSNINTAAQTVSTAASSEQTAYATWTSASQTLASEEAPSKQEDIKAQIATVAQAQASVDSANAKIQDAEIIAPISGTITQFDAKVGQLASPGTPLISIMSSDGYEVDAGASETDVGKISLGNKVTMTLDALPNETFTGSVFYIAPAQTNTQGVISYQIKVSFDLPDPRFKSGFTANMTINTNQKDNVLVLPQYGILQNDQGTFVETLVNGKVVQTPITLGIQDQKGNVEILSGVTLGEQVLNIGLKTQ